MADRLEFEILAKDAASRSFRTAAAGAADLAKNLDITALSSEAAAEALKKTGKASDLTAAQSAALARVLKLTGSEEDKLAAKALLASAAVKRLDTSMAESGVAAAELAGSSAAGGGLPGVINPMTGLIAAGVALSPIIATLGTGLAGFGAAAYATVSPVLKAAQATGGLKANLATLTPAQKGVAQGFLGLQGDFDKFARSLQPQVFSALHSGLGIAKTLLTDVQPVALATGKAFDQIAASVAGGLKSAEWQQFFSWMAANAGPDLLLVGQAVGALVSDLPPLLEGLQPVAVSLLHVATYGAEAFGALQDVNGSVIALQGSATGLGTALKAVSAGQGGHSGFLSFLSEGWHGLQLLNTSSGTAGQTAKSTAKSFGTMGKAAALSATQVTDLYKALHTLLDPLTQNIGDAVTFKNDQVALSSALKKSHDALGLHTVAQRASSQAAATAAQDALTLSQSIYTATGSASKAIRPLQSLASELQNSGAKGDYARQIMRELAAAIAALHSKTIDVTVNTTNYRFLKNVQGRASGGWAAGLTMVGERGPELLKLPAGSYVYNHAQTAALVSGRSGGTTTAVVRPRGGSGGSVRVVLEVRAATGTPHENYIAGLIKKYVSVKGGGDVQVALGRTA